MTYSNQSPNDPPEHCPPVSTYKSIKVCLCIPAVKMDLNNKIFVFNRWRCQISITPILLIFCALFFLILNSIFLFPHFGLEGKIMNGVTALFCLLFIISYTLTIFIGPGFFPYYWYQKKLQSEGNIDNNEYNFLIHEDDNSPSGIITMNEQFLWAKSKPRPPRSILSSSEGRIIIRPDHFCFATTSWIGKRNHKFFIIFNIYNFIYCLLIILYSVRLIVFQFKNEGWVWKFHFLFAFISIIFGLYFGFFSLMFFIYSCYFAVRGYTSLELTMLRKNVSVLNKGLKRNLEDIFGPIKCLPCWLCPSYPWLHKTNQELVMNEIIYHDFKPENNEDQNQNNKNVLEI